MKKIDKYMLKELFLPVVFGVSLITFALMIDIIRSIAEILIVKSVSLLEVLMMFSFLTPQILVTTIPLGVFFGIMMTYNSMSSTSEMVALQSSGMSLNRILRTPIIIGVITTLGIYGFQEKVLPLAQYKADMLIKKIAYSKPSTQLQPKQFISNVGPMSIYVENFRDENIAEKLMGFMADGRSAYPMFIHSEETIFRNSEIENNKVKTYMVASKDYPNQSRREITLIEGKLDKWIIPISNFFGDPRGSKVTEQSLGLKDLRKTIFEMKSIGEEYKKYEIEFYRKLYTPIGALIFAVLGPLLSIRHSRTIKGLNLGMSLGIIFAYIGLQEQLLAVSENNQLAPVYLFIPNLVLLIITIFAYRAQSRR